MVSRIKIKAESYNNFKGINNKVSEYNNTQYEVRDLQNLSFQHPGAWDSRPGTTAFFNISLNSECTGLYEYRRITPFFTTGVETVFKMMSDSWNNLVSTTLAGALYTYNPNSQSLIVVLPDISPSGGQPFPMDFVTFTDTLFGANGYIVYKYNGVSAEAYGLPGASYIPLPITVNTYPLVIGTSYVGEWNYGVGWVNNQGYYGPIGNTFLVTVGTLAVSIPGFTAPTTQQAGYGISALAIYRSRTPGAALLEQIAQVAPGETFIDFFGPAGLENFGQAQPTNIYLTLVPKYLELFNNSLFLLGFSTLPSTFYFSDVGDPESIQPESFVEVRTDDGDILTGARSYRGDLIIFKEKSFHKLIGDSPENYTLVEISNQYGCVSNKAAVEFEGVLWFLDPSGIVEFNGAIPKIVSTKVDDTFKKMAVSFARQTACAVHYKSRREVWFCIPTVDAFRDFPGTEEPRYINDTIVVYDYFSDAWTTYKGVFPSTLAPMTSFIPTLDDFGNTLIIEEPRIYGGSYSGSVFYYDEDLFSDYYGAFTCLVQTRFLADLGNSVTKEFRRFFLDVTPRSGVTQVFGIKMFTDYSESASLDRLMPITPFQSRMEMGLEAKALAVEITYSSATLPLQINGNTLEYRELRRV